jgi:hypothetical protein
MSKYNVEEITLAPALKESERRRRMCDAQGNETFVLFLPALLRPWALNILILL